MTTTIDHVGRSDTETPARLPDEQGVVEVRVTYWRNVRGPTHVVYRTTP